MPDREKVIRGLEQFIADFKPFCGNKADWQRVYDALALLKAQEPIAPIQGGDDQDEDIFCCGSCGAVVGETFLGPPGECEVRDNYCPECGRAVKWK